MHVLNKLGVGAVVAAVLIGGGTTAANAATVSPTVSRHDRGAVFAQTDDVAGNHVVAYDRDADGNLHQTGIYSTGGLGGTLGQSVIDRTASQGALINAGGTLIAVNAGSNTITTFGISGDRLYRRQVLSSGGSFPVSVTAHGAEVYVLNARDGGSVQGYLNVRGYLVPVARTHRDLNLNTTQTPEFTSTPGEVSFTPDGSKVIVSTKNAANSLEVFDNYGLFGLSQRPVVTTIPGSVPFGFTFDRAGHLVTTEAGPSAIASFRVNRNGTLTQTASAATGQAATCWIVANGDHVYTSNAGSGSLSEYTVRGDGQLTAGSVTATDKGTVDAAVSPDGRNLYVQTGAAGLIDSYAIGSDGSLRKLGAISLPNGVGAEGIVAN